MKIQTACRLIGHKEKGLIEIDTATALHGALLRRGSIVSAPILPWNGFWNATKRRNPKPHHCGEVQYLLVCRIQGTGDRAVEARDHGQCGDDEDRERDACVNFQT